ncbi:DUF2877 domain-containing protein [Clostridium gasigenes]|uniref:DUF2877 domain-containing protein n=1 Tax=Clostridium gasigenes TaxID=94869 RepID=UPI001C0CCBFB|nr:DUF2877 domain-containing protein [Clostridium gasigenes]MBU3138226.1 DUF2877 domain-containing protein [Clostridium gasigenes]
MGRVHSMFKKGFNVKFGDSLIYITSNKYPLSALGVNITEEKLRKILSSIKISDVVTKKEEKLLFYTINEIIDIDYKFIERIDLSFPKVKCKITDIKKSELYNALASIDFEEIIGIELDKNTLKYVDLLVNSDKKDLDTNKLIINFFVGRGKGLTPSGDDILIGFTAALIIFEKYKEWIFSLKQEVTTGKTTIISSSYLSSLLEGYVSEDFIELIKSLDYKKSILIEEAIEKVKAFGHTSGCDTLFGFILGLKFLINNLKN